MELFGGAVTLDLPDGLLDASQIRQVPDNQEVFLSREDSSFSIIVEIVEPPSEPVAEDSLAAYYFQDLAEETDSAFTVSDQGRDHNINGTLVWISGHLQCMNLKETRQSSCFMTVIVLNEVSAHILITWNNCKLSCEQILTHCRSWSVKDWSLFATK